MLVAPALPLSHSPGAGLFGACVVGLSAGVEISVLAYLIPRYFGARHYGLLFSVMNSLVIIGLGVGPFGARYLYDLAANYRLVLLITASLYATSAVLSGTLGNANIRFPAPGVVGAARVRA